MAMPRSRSRPNAPVVRVQTVKADTRVSTFSWVLTERPAPYARTQFSSSQESLTRSDDTHQSSSVASIDGDDLAGEVASPTSSPKKAIQILAQPRIVNQDDNMPLNAKARKAALAKSTDKSPSKPSIVPTAFKFGLRGKPGSGDSQSDTEATTAARPPPGARTPIHSRFAKANRESWIEKKGSRDAAKGPIIPSRANAPTLSFITQLPPLNELPPVAFMPPLPANLRNESGKRSPSPSPVQRMQSTPVVVKRQSPELRVRSPEPKEVVEGPLPTPALLRIAYPQPTKPAPTGPLPERPSSRMASASPVEGSRALSPTMGSPSRSGRATPTLPVGGQFKVTVQTRLPAEPTRVTGVTKTTSPVTVRSPIVKTTISAPVSPVEEPRRAFSPAPTLESGLRRTPSLPPARRVSPLNVVRGREHPFPLRPVVRLRTIPEPGAGPAINIQEIPLAGFYLAPGQINDIDGTASLHLAPPFAPSEPRMSDAPSSMSMYSEVSISVSDVEQHRLLTADDSETRRMNLMSNVGKLIAQDGRVIGRAY